jgi:hypothetical protein
MYNKVIRLSEKPSITSKRMLPRIRIIGNRTTQLGGNFLYIN